MGCHLSDKFVYFHIYKFVAPSNFQFLNPSCFRGSYRLLLKRKLEVTKRQGSKCHVYFSHRHTDTPGTAGNTHDLCGRLHLFHLKITVPLRRLVYFFGHYILLSQIPHACVAPYENIGHNINNAPWFHRN